METEPESHSERTNTTASRNCTLVALSLLALYIICYYFSYYPDYMDEEVFPLFKILLALALIAGSLLISRLTRISIWIKGSALGVVALAILPLVCMGNVEVFDVPSHFPTCYLFTVGIVFLAYAVLGKWAGIPLFFLFFEETLRVVCSIYLKVTFNAHVLAAVFGTSRDEALPFITTKNVAAFIAIVAVISLLLYILTKALKGERRTRCALFGVFVFGFALFFRYALTPVLLNRPCGLWPISGARNFTSETLSGIEKDNKLLALVRSLPSPANQPSHISTLKGGEGAICIVHVGESVRADHLSLNGYEKDTTPWLRSQERLINYPRCISSSPETNKAFIGLLTNARFNVERSPSEEYMPTVGSVMDLFAANGFACSSFVPVPVRLGNPLCGIMLQLTRKSRMESFINGLPLPQVDSILDRVAASGNENLFILANNYGSHIPFHLYEDDKAPFQPTSKTAFVENPDGAPQRAVEVRNAYDNTIYTLDRYIQRLVTGLKGKPFIYIYVSDHGDYTGEEGLWNRVEMMESEKYYYTTGCIVPMLVYASPEFEALHPHFSEALQELRRHSGMTVAHEHLFHTLLGLFGISTPYYDATLDLSSPAAEPYTGPQPGGSVKIQDGGWH